MVGINIYFVNVDRKVTRRYYGCSVPSFFSPISSIIYQHSITNCMTVSVTQQNKMMPPSKNKTIPIILLFKNILLLNNSLLITYAPNSISMYWFKLLMKNTLITSFKQFDTLGFQIDLVLKNVIGKYVTFKVPKSKHWFTFLPRFVWTRWVIIEWCLNINFEGFRIMFSQFN